MKGLVAVLLGLTLGSCGSSSGGGDPKALCMQGTQAFCDKIYDCPEAEPYRSALGATKADCVSGLNASQCTSTTGCDPGATYHGDQAQACLNAFKALTCAQLSDPNVIQPASCDMVCTGP
jgi:hypothetical protein